MKLVSIVIPVLNEIENLPRLAGRLAAVADGVSAQSAGEIGLEFVFVDDGSTDGSYPWLAKLTEREPRARVVKLSRNFGSYIALTAGMAEASGEAAVTLSADMQDPPELVPELIAKWREGYDVVWGLRRSREQDPLLRRVAAGLFYWLLRRVAFPNYPPRGYDFCLISRQVIDTVITGFERNTSIFALIVWANFETATLQYDRVARERGESHWGARKLVKLALDSLISFSGLPVRLSLFAALALGLTLVGYLLFILYGKLTGRLTFPDGWPSTMTVILATSSVQLVALSILGEYLLRTLDQTRRRPLYVVSRRLGGPIAARGAGASASQSLRDRE